MTPVPPGLDLAFSCDEALSAEQLEAAGPLADPATAEGPWRDLLAAWLELRFCYASLTCFLPDLGKGKLFYGFLRRCYFWVCV